MAAVMAGKDTGDMEDSMLDHGPIVKARKGPFQSCQWFMVCACGLSTAYCDLPKSPAEILCLVGTIKERPLTRWMFVVMLLFGPANLFWIIMKASSGITGDILCGLAAIVLALWGAKHFHFLLGLKKAVEDFARNNRELKATTGDMQRQVDKLMKAQRELAATHDQLNETTREYKDNIAKFKALDEKLNSLADDSIAGLGALKEMSKNVQASIVKEMKQHERDVLSTTFQSVELRDDQDGLSEQEFNQFVSALPANFQERFSTMSEQGKSFKDIAGDDGIMDMDEFTTLCDEFAEQAVAGNTMKT